MNGDANYRLVWVIIFLVIFPDIDALSQCSTCVSDPSCSSDDGFPTICPESLASGTVGEFYEGEITFFLPEEVIDPGSGLVADLNSVSITGITGVPLGMIVELDDDDAVYYPSDGQTLGCASICGEPLIAGTFEMVISISAVASVLGIEQVVVDTFPYILEIVEGVGGNSIFSYSPPSGCDSIVANFQAFLFGNPNQITSYTWNFGNGQIANSAAVDGVLFDAPGTYDITLETTISDHVLTEVYLSNTAGGGLDDLWSPSPDPYFVVNDAAGNNVYTSSTVDETYSNTWSDIGLVLTNPPYTIAFYDEDFFITDDDFLGSMAFSLNGSGTFDINADPSYGSLTIELQTAVNTSDTSQIVVNGSPEVGLMWSTQGDSLIAFGEDLIDYAWYWGDSLVATGLDSAFVPQQNGWYTAHGTSSLGCTGVSDSLLYCSLDATFALNLSLGELPEVVAANFDFNVSDWEFIWTFNGEVSDTLTGISNWPTDASGWYTAEAWDPFGCPWVSDSALVCWPLNTPWIEEDENGLLSVVPTYADYQWWLNGEPIANATDSTYQTIGPGLYTVSVTDFADCPGVISDEWLVTQVVEASAVAPQYWTVYPNPVSSQLTFDLPSEADGFTVQVVAMNGAVIETARVQAGSIMSVIHWSTGTYILKAQSRSTGNWLPAVRVIRH